MVPISYFIGVFVFLLLSYLVTYNRKGRGVGSYSSFLVLVIYPLLFLGLEGLQGDIVHYEIWYNNLSTPSQLFNSVYFWKGDFIFFGIIIFSNFLDFSYTQFIVVQAFLKSAIIFSTLYFSSTRLPVALKSRIYILGTLFIFAEPYFHFFMGNVLRQGFGVFLLILFLAIFSRGSPKLSFLVFLASFFSHKSSVVGLSVLFKKFNVKSIILIAISFAGIVLIFLNTSWFSKVESYTNQGLGFSGSSGSKRTYALLHVAALVFLMKNSSFFRGVNIEFEPQKKLLNYLYITLVAISFLSLALAPLSINLHYRFFGEFIFLFSFLLAIRLSLAVVNNTSFAIGCGVVFLGYLVVVLNPSIINIYVGL